MSTATSHINTIKSWLNEITSEKVKSADKPITEVAGYDGGTVSDTFNVDDEARKFKPGARASENEADIKKTVPANVDEAKERSADSDINKEMSVGTRRSAVGEDPSTEDNFRKAPSSQYGEEALSSWKEQGGDGYKSSGDMRKAAKCIADLANELMADMAAETISAEKTASTSNSQSNSNQSTNAQANLNAAQAGYELAAFLGMSKEAADKTASAVVEDTIKRASVSADRVAQHLVWYMQQKEASLRNKTGVEIGRAVNKPTTKRAAEGPPHTEPDGDEGGAAGNPAPGGPPEAAGAPPEEMTGAAPGGLPPTGGPGEEGGAGSVAPEQALQELSHALLELGISPEELMAALQSSMGGAGGPQGMPGMSPETAGGAGMPPMPQEAAMAGAGGAPEMLGKVASAVKDFRLSGNFKISEAKTAAQREYRNNMKSYIIELLQAVRR